MTSAQVSEAGRHVERVWYVSYGSNLLKRRFHTYLTGGPIPGATDGRTQDGARDASPPTADRPVEIDRTLLFALNSSRWGGGGVAFVDPAERPATPTLGRAWNISREQLEDVLRQENRQQRSVSIDLVRLARLGHLDAYSSAYGRLIHLGNHDDGLPEVTLSCPSRPPELNEAHTSYLAVMTEGLSECWGLDAPEAAAYLAGIPQPPRAQR